jgi:hypothetical protein
MNRISCQPDAGLPELSGEKYPVIFELLPWAVPVQPVPSNGSGEDPDGSGDSHSMEPGGNTTKSGIGTGQSTVPDETGNWPGEQDNGSGEDPHYILSDEFTSPEIFPPLAAPAADNTGGQGTVPVADPVKPGGSGSVDTQQYGTGGSQPGTFQDPGSPAAGHGPDGFAGYPADTVTLDTGDTGTVGAAMPEHDFFALSLYGSAFFQGTEGIVEGMIDANITDFGAYSIAVGTVRFSATAVGYGDEPVHAQAMTGADFIDADLVFSSTFFTGMTFGYGDSQISVSYSETWFVAIDIDGASPVGGTVYHDLFPAPGADQGAGYSLPANALDSLLSRAVSLVGDEKITQEARVSENGYVLAPSGHVQVSGTALTNQDMYSYIDAGAYLIA